ncbi:adenylate/guanylate cyclase [Candidatus Magnetobacterium bavaricum]|uniref:Adenylate/guanylate cyclase n=2 Tax=Candidatus Magnetobacterium bavaricum TaxID=29290 RepID=A0A0F3GW25_9BACT|nr:adenylate/guanylate cyclase [Candidatus Magnetobacterium bavaricum]
MPLPPKDQGPWVGGIPEEKTENFNMEQLLEKKKKIDSLLHNKYTKWVTIMFTDLEGSTVLTEEAGDLALRTVIKNQNDIIHPIINTFKGIYVKSIGDGTLSYFESGSNAVGAAIDIQKAVAKYNQKEEDMLQIHLRIGLNTGNCIVEHNDVFGDVVNVAQRFESIANTGEIYLSEETFNSLDERYKQLCRYIKTTSIKGKKEAFKVYMALWDDVSTNNISVNKLDVAPILKVERTGYPPFTVPIREEEILIGRAGDCGVSLTEHFVSRYHAHVFLLEGAYYIEDLQSQSGISLNDKAINSSVLKHGDVIKIGPSIVITFLQSHTEDSIAMRSTQDKLRKEIGKIVALYEQERYRVIVLQNNSEIQQHVISTGGLLIGRTGTCDIQLPEQVVSSKHARLWFNDNGIYIVDLESTNGVLLNGIQIPANKEIKLTLTDRIEIGSFTLKLIPSNPDDELYE